jgi:hypothetical protein
MICENCNYDNIDNDDTNIICYGCHITREWSWYTGKLHEIKLMILNNVYQSCTYQIINYVKLINDKFKCK